MKNLSLAEIKNANWQIETFANIEIGASENQRNADPIRTSRMVRCENLRFLL
jgi:hypothetical protein